MATASSDSRAVRAVSLAAPVAALVRGAPGSRGSVLMVHDTAITVGVGDELLTIARCGTGGLPSGVLVDDTFAPRRIGVRPGADVALDPAAIRLPGLVVDLRSADTWSPVLPRHARPADSRERAEAVRWAAGKVAAGKVAAGRSAARSSATGRALGPAVRDPVAAAFALRRATLEHALRHGDEAAIVAAGLGLIGLGPGLTPSGDDVLVGLGAVLSASGDPLAVRVTPRWAAAAVRGTTDVAAAFHRSAARGQFAERVHDLVARLLDGPLQEIPLAVERAATWGATSGLDLVEGMALGLDRIASPSLTAPAPAESA